jgi:hypothetical protein
MSTIAGRAKRKRPGEERVEDPASRAAEKCVGYRSVSGAMVGKPT